MIYWQITIGLIFTVQIVKNITGISGRWLILVLGVVGLVARWLVKGQFDPWVGLVTVAVAAFVYDILVYPAIETFWHLFKNAIKKPK